jgi:hypothetical protein
MAIKARSDSPGWESVAHEIGLWTISSKGRGGVTHRTCALRLKSKGFLIIGPSPTVQKRGHAELKRMGPVEAVLALNHFQADGVAAFCKEHPSAAAVCTKPARKRLIAKTGLEVHGLDRLRENMPSPGMLHVPSGLTSGEVWVRATMRRGRGWIVGDAFNNIIDSLGVITNAWLRMSLAAPGLRISRQFLSASVNDVGVYRAWAFNRLREDRPSVLIPRHGDVLIHADLPTRLKHIIDERLGG